MKPIRRMQYLEPTHENVPSWKIKALLWEIRHEYLIDCAICFVVGAATATVVIKLIWL
jgi:hypothetical protein